MFSRPLGPALVAGPDDRQPQQRSLTPPGLAASSQPSSSSTPRTSDVNVPPSLLFSFPVPHGQSPQPRWAHAAVLLQNQHMLVHGGIGVSLLDDVCLLDTRTMSWRRVEVRGDLPERCMGHAAVLLDRRVWLFGGQQGRKMLARLASLCTETWTFTRYSPERLPSARAGHAVAAVRHAGSPDAAYIFGGQGKKMLNDLHVMRATDGVPQFQDVPGRGAVPKPRRGHSLVWDGADALILFGGTHAGGIDSALHAFSLSRQEWCVPAATGPAPSARTQHTAVMIGPHAMLVFGGCNAQGVFFNDCHILDTVRFEWSRPALLSPAPAPRYHHSCVVAGGRALIYGGVNSKATCDGLAVADARFAQQGHELSHIAAELAAMVGQGQAGNQPPAPLLLPVRPHPLPASDPGGGGGSGSAMAAEFMKAQLTDLLLKRGLEELHAQAVQRAEAAETALAAEKARNDAQARDLLALRLMVAESEAAAGAWEAKAREATARAAKSAALVEEAAAEAAEARREAQGLQAELDAARSLQQGLIKELGVLSSRYTRLHQNFAATQRRRGGSSGGRAGSPQPAAPQRYTGPRSADPDPAQHAQQQTRGAGGGEAMAPTPGAPCMPVPQEAADLAPESPGRRSPTPARSLSRASAPARCASPVPPLSSSPESDSSPVAWESGPSRVVGSPANAPDEASAPAPARVAAVRLSMSTLHVVGAGEGQDAGSTLGGARASRTRPTGSSRDAAAAQLLRLLNVAEQQRAAAVEQLADLTEKHAALRCEHDAATATLGHVTTQLARLTAAEPAISQLGLLELQRLEQELDATGRKVRELVMQRALQQAAAPSAKPEPQALCGVCLEAPRAMVFGCGHQACGGCSAKLDTCPWCRLGITARIRLYDS